MSNPKDTKMTPISALIEVFPLCQKVILNTVDFKDHGFTKTQLCILLSLTAKSPLTMSELAAYIASSNEQATRAVAPLVKAGYLERIQDEKNRKLVLVQLTLYGKEMMQIEEVKLKETMAAKTNNLSPEEREAFAQAVNTTVQILKKLQ